MLFIILNVKLVYYNKFCYLLMVFSINLVENNFFYKL